MFVSTIFNEGDYLTQSIFHKALKDGIFAICFLRIFENLESPSVSLLMLCAKQGNNGYLFFYRLWYDTASIRYTLYIVIQNVNSPI